MARHDRRLLACSLINLLKQCKRVQTFPKFLFKPVLSSTLVLPPRTIPTPQQAPQSLPPHTGSLNGMGPVPFKPNASPKGPTNLQSNTGSVQGGNAMTNFISPISMVGMDKAQFDSNFKTFLTRRGGNMDSHLRFLEDRPLDLHSLYNQRVVCQRHVSTCFLCSYADAYLLDRRKWQTRGV